MDDRLRNQSRTTMSTTNDAALESFTLDMPRWWRRLRDRNPLLRTSDRFELLVGVAAVVIMLLAIPIAGAVGTAVYDTSRSDGTQTTARQLPAPPNDTFLQPAAVEKSLLPAEETGPSIARKAAISALATWTGAAAIAAAGHSITRAVCARTRSRGWERALDQLISNGPPR